MAGEAAEVRDFRAAMLALRGGGVAPFCFPDSHLTVRVPCPGGAVNGVDRGPGFAVGMRGEAEQGVWDASPESSFVAGGWHRGDALAHLDIIDGSVSFVRPGVLGPAFDRYLADLGHDELFFVVSAYLSGVDAVAMFSTGYVEGVRPVRAAERAERRHRLVKERNSPKVGCRAGVAGRVGALLTLWCVCGVESADRRPSCVNRSRSIEPLCAVTC